MSIHQKSPDHLIGKQMISPAPESACSTAVTAKFGTLLFLSGQECISEKTTHCARQFSGLVFGSVFGLK
jgi:hypothetical protein